MIPSYQEEIKAKDRKNMIFWSVVFLLACYLYLFFQWYYLNIDFNLKTEKPTEIFKQFWIINVQVFPNPDAMFVSWVKYSNISKSIFNLWKYEVSMQREWYIPVSLNINLNKNNLFYTNTINLIKTPLYHEIIFNFDSISNIWDYYLAINKDKKLLEIFDKKLSLIKTLTLSDYNYIWKNYFSLNSLIYVYDYDLNAIKPFLSKDQIPKNIECKNVRLINDDLFCFDTMVFLTSSRDFWKDESILRINSNVILTQDFIYNNSSDPSWSYYKHEDKNFVEPESIVQVDWLTYYLKDWSLYTLQSKKQEKLIVPEISDIIKAQNFQDELFLAWYDKSKRATFLLYDWKRRYTGYLDNINLNSLEISKNNWIYFFNAKNSFYIYYKWWKNIIKIIDWNILWFFDNKAFFKMNWKNYYLQLLED